MLNPKVPNMSELLKAYRGVTSETFKINRSANSSQASGEFSRSRGARARASGVLEIAAELQDAVFLGHRLGVSKIAKSLAE